MNRFLVLLLIALTVVQAVPIAALIGAPADGGDWWGHDCKVCGRTLEEASHEACISVYAASMHSYDHGLAPAPAVPLALEDVGFGPEMMTSSRIECPVRYLISPLRIAPPFKVPIA